ncbi:MAG TPA: phosphatase [Cyclobacteriaceae bacterium]|nr:phosphatase [Cyclobacteriaceae bacterium]
MKKILGTLILLTLFTAGHGQNGKIQRALTPARGHYKQLSAFSPKPKSSNEETDKQKFITDKETVDRRMSLTPVYLKSVTVDDFKIPEVPANSSEQTRAEINYLLALQNSRTDEEVRASLYMADIYYNLRVKPEDSTYTMYRRNLFHIGSSIGSWFNPDDLPVTANLIANVWRDASYFIWSLKFKYARIRPVFIDSDIKNLQETDWAAYPSGHASNSYINAYIYQELAPEFTDVFIKDAYDMAHSREILGVHYPSDSESGRIFARQFVNMLFQNPDFVKDFELVKEEWAEKAKETFLKPKINHTGAIEKKSSCASSESSCSKKVD